MRKKSIILLAMMLLMAGGQALAFKKQFKSAQWIHSNVNNAEVTHVMLTDTATIVTFHKHDTANGIRFARDEYNQLMELFQFNGIPHYETLDKLGNVVRNGLNYGLYDKDAFENKLKELKKQLE